MKLDQRHNRRIMMLNGERMELVILKFWLYPEIMIYNSPIQEMNCISKKILYTVVFLQVMRCYFDKSSWTKPWPTVGHDKTCLSFIHSFWFSFFKRPNQTQQCYKYLINRNSVMSIKAFPYPFIEKLHHYIHMFCFFKKVYFL